MDASSRKKIRCRKPADVLVDCDEFAAALAAVRENGFERETAGCNARWELWPD